VKADPEQAGYPVMRGPIEASVWEGIEAEFGLPTLEQVRERLAAQLADPEPVLRQVLRVFIDEDAKCPGFQFLPGDRLHPAVTGLFRRALELKVPHNYFAAWIVTGNRGLGGVRPVDVLPRKAQLLQALEAYAVTGL
jgi:hypothetical protein